MPLDERKDRWRDMMDVLRENSIDHWTANCLRAIGGDNSVEPDCSLHPAGDIIRSGVIQKPEPWLASSPIWSSLGY